MLIVKLSTAASIEIGPVLDSAGAEVTSTMVIGDFRLVKNGTGAAMAASASITHVANGHYTLSMTTGNTDTLGTLTVSCHKTGVQMPRSQMMVVPVKVYDSIVAGSDNLEVDAIQLLGTAILTPATAGTMDVNTKLLGGATVTATTSVTIPASSTLATTTGAVGSVTGAVGSVTGLTVANLDAAVSTRMATYAQPTGFLAATFPATVASTTNITAGTITTVSAVTGLTVANLDTTVSSRASQTSLDTLDDYVDTEVGAIKTKTDQLTFTVANKIDANTLTIGANVITASALATDAVNEIADQVWDELLSGHTGVGSTGAGLSAAGAAGDPWSTALPGAYGAGTAGKIVGDNVNATISSRASQTSLDTLDDYVDTEVGAIKTKTDQLTFTVANQIDANTLTIGANVITAAAIATDAIGSAEISAAAVTKIQSGLATPTNITAGTITTVSSVTGLTAANLDTTVSSRASQTSLDTLDDYVDTEVGAIKTKTDQLTFTVANKIDANTLTIGANVITASALATDAVNEIADQVWDELLSGHTGAGSTGAGLTSASSAGDPWSTALPGAYGAGTAGKIVGDNVNATISSRASQTSLDALDASVTTASTEIF